MTNQFDSNVSLHKERKKSCILYDAQHHISTCRCIDFDYESSRNVPPHRFAIRSKGVYDLLVLARLVEVEMAVPPLRTDIQRDRLHLVHAEAFHDLGWWDRLRADDDNSEVFFIFFHFSDARNRNRNEANRARDWRWETPRGQRFVCACEYVYVCARCHPICSGPQSTAFGMNLAGRQAGSHTRKADEGVLFFSFSSEKSSLFHPQNTLVVSKPTYLMIRKGILCRTSITSTQQQ